MIFGGGGSTISKEDEILIEKAGVTKIYGTQYSITRIVKDILNRIKKNRKKYNYSSVYHIESLVTGARNISNKEISLLLTIAECRGKNIPLAYNKEKYLIFLI